MKTYAELEREAYITGNTEMAKAYAAADDAERIEDFRGELSEANDKLRDIAYIVSGY
jgi:hypothetical protein